MLYFLSWMMDKCVGIMNNNGIIVIWIKHAIYLCHLTQQQHWTCFITPSMKYFLPSPCFHGYFFIPPWQSLLLIALHFLNLELQSQTPVLCYLLSLTRCSHPGSASRYALYTGDSSVYISSPGLSPELKIFLPSFLLPPSIRHLAGLPNMHMQYWPFAFIWPLWQCSSFQWQCHPSVAQNRNFGFIQFLKSFFCSPIYQAMLAVWVNGSFHPEFSPCLDGDMHIGACFHINVMGTGAEPPVCYGIAHLG